MFLFNDGVYVGMGVNNTNRAFEDMRHLFQLEKVRVDGIFERMKHTKAYEYILAAKESQAEPYCYYCGVIFRDSTMVDEHVYPLSAGGLDGPENIVTACTNCNISKGPRTPNGLRNYLAHLNECDPSLIKFFHEILTGEEIRGKWANP